MNDDIILVDIFDSEIGHTDKDDAHRRGLLHRAFSVFVIHDGRMLIQKRSRDKYHSGGLWTNACCSHPREGESLDQAVPRRMREELGFSSRAEELFSFVYRHVFSDGLVEYEFDHVFLADYDGESIPSVTPSGSRQRRRRSSGSSRQMHILTERDEHPALFCSESSGSITFSPPGSPIGTAFSVCEISQCGPSHPDESPSRNHSADPTKTCKLR